MTVMNTTIDGGDTLQKGDSLFVLGQICRFPRVIIRATSLSSSA